MTEISSSKDVATLEYDALGDLGEYVSNILGLSPLTKAMVNQTIAGIQETLRMAWGIDVVEESKDPGFFEITDDLLQQHAIQMKTADGQWVGVSHTAFDKLPGGVIIRLLFYDITTESFYEANGKTEFLLTNPPQRMGRDATTAIEDIYWHINYK